MLYDVRAQKEREKRKKKIYTQYNRMVQIINGLLISMRSREVAAEGMVARFSEADEAVVKCKCS